MVHRESAGPLERVQDLWPVSRTALRDGHHGAARPAAETLKHGARVVTGGGGGRRTLSAGQLHGLSGQRAHSSA